METTDHLIVSPVGQDNQDGQDNPLGQDSQEKPALVHNILMEPFRSSTWKRLVYIALAVPVGVLCIPLALVGGPAGRVQAGLARRLLDVEIEERPRHRLRALALAVLSVPINLAAAIVSFYFWLVVVINLGYPLRPNNDYQSSWGGPTLIGAWALHAAFGGVVFLFVSAWVMHGMTALQARLAKGFLGTGHSRLLRTIILAMATASVCAAVAVPVIHQL